MPPTIKTISKQEFAHLMQDGLLGHTFYQTAAGSLRIYTIDGWIYKTEFSSEQKTEKFPNRSVEKTYVAEKLLLVGTPFQHAVWQAALQIPHGQKATYTDIAQAIGKPKSIRAVANALGDNRIAYFIPCHRVLRKSGDLCGYFWGIEKKEALLKDEGEFK